jgi:hypothetical protein
VDRLQQILLAAGQVEAGHVEALAVLARLPRRVPLVLAELPVRRGVEDGGGPLGVREAPFEEAQPHLLAQDSPHRTVDERLRQHAAPHVLDERAHVRVLVRDAHVHPGCVRASAPASFMPGARPS